MKIFALFSYLALSAIGSQAFVVQHKSAYRSSCLQRFVSSESPPPPRESLDLESLPIVQDFAKSFSKIKDIDMDRLAKNSMPDGDAKLGSRGEAWFVAQAAIVLAVAAGLPLPIISPLLGPALLITGASVALAAAVDLAAAGSLTPWPDAQGQSQLETDGWYAYVRHPIYAGLLAACTGMALSTASVDRSLWVVALYLVLDAKTQIEEASLIEQYGDEYQQYKKSVPNKFVPKINVVDTIVNKFK